MPDKLAGLEAEQQRLEIALADPDFFSRDPEAFNAAAARMVELDDEQTETLVRWETVEARLAELKG